MTSPYRQTGRWQWELIPVSLIIALFSYFYLAPSSLRIFDFWDMSIFMDGGYRVLNGQIPYVDFFYFAGPVHLYMHALFFKIFGFGKTAIQWHLCVVNGLVCIAAYFTVRHRLPVSLSFFVLLVVLITFYWPNSHPWYDQNAIFWFILTLPFFELTRNSKDSRTSTMLGVWCAFCMALSFLTKANVGFFASVLIFCALLLTLDWKRKVLIFVGLTPLFTILLLSFSSPLDFFEQSFVTSNVVSRLWNLDSLLLIIQMYPFVYFLPVVGITLVAHFAGRLDSNHSDKVFLIGIPLLGLLSKWTSSYSGYYQHLCGFFLLYALFIFSGYKTQNLIAQKTIKGFLIVVMLLTGLSYIKIAYKLNLFLSRYDWNEMNTDSTYKLTAKNFEGWHSGQSIGPDVDRVLSYMESNIPKEDSVFVFPDSTVIYGMSGHESYRYVPLNFYYKKSPAPGKQYDKFQSHFLSSPPKWIVLHDQWPSAIGKETVNDMLSWLNLSEFINRNYQEVQTFGKFEILKFKEGAELPSE